MNDLEKDLTIYDRLPIFISKVKTIDNEKIKKKFTLEIEKIYLGIKKLKARYENLASKEEENLFFQEKQNYEISISLKLDELENEYETLKEEIPEIEGVINVEL